MALQVGDTAPDFEMPTDDGSSIWLSALRGKKVVLYFYPKDDTPGCTVEACSFRDNLPDFKGVNAEIIGVSRDDGASHQRFRNKFGLNFTLASDVTGKVTEDYGVWTEKSMYGKTFMGIQRATFLIDEKGKIMHIFPKVSVEGHTAEVLAALKGELPLAAPAPAKPAAKKKAKPAAKPVAAKKPATKKAVKKKAPAKKKAAPKTAKKTVKLAKKSAKKASKKVAKKTAKKTVGKKAKKKAAKKK